MGLVRFLLAISVTLAHVPSRSLLGFDMIAADTSVQAFFLISGFYMALVLTENGHYSSTRIFYASRYMRLWPIYIVCAAASLLLFRQEYFLAHMGSWCLVHARRMLPA